MVRSEARLSISGWFLPLRFPDLRAEGPLLWAAHYRNGSIAGLRIPRANDRFGSSSCPPLRHDGPFPHRFSA